MILQIQIPLQLQIWIEEDNRSTLRDEGAPGPSVNPTLLAVDEVGYFSFLIEGIENPKDLLAIDEDQLKKIQEDKQAKLKERDARKEQDIQDKFTELEQRYDLASKEMLKNFAKVSVMLNPDQAGGATEVKSDEMVMMPSQF